MFSMHSTVLSNDLEASSNLLYIVVISVEVLSFTLNSNPLEHKEGKPLVVSISVGTREPSRILIHCACSISIGCIELAPHSHADRLRVGEIKELAPGQKPSPQLTKQSFFLDSKIDQGAINPIWTFNKHFLGADYAQCLFLRNKIAADPALVGGLWQ